MNSKNIVNETATLLTTAEWYEKEKHLFSLRSHQRPQQVITMPITFRQTKFPEQCE